MRNTVQDVIRLSSELRNNGTIKPTIRLGEVKSDSGMVADPQEFLSKTYPTKDIKSALEEISGRFENEEGGIFRMTGNYGSGKSHFQVLLYHLFNTTESSEWLERYDMGGLNFPNQSRTVIYSLQQSQHEYFWNPFFESIGHSDMWEVNEGHNAYPTREEIESRLPEEPVLVLIDEIEDYYQSIDDESERAQIRGFLQALTEVSADPKNNLFVVVSLLELDPVRINEIFYREESTGISLNDSPDKSNIIKARIFDLESMDKSIRNEIIGLYYAKYKDSNEIEVNNDYKEEMKRSYPFHPELLSAMKTQFYNSKDYQNTRGLMFLLSEVAKEYSDKVDYFLTGNVNIMKDSISQELDKLRTSVINEAKTDLKENIEPENIKKSDELISCITLYSLSMEDPENNATDAGARNEEQLLGLLRPNMKVQDVYDIRDRVNRHSHNLRRINGHWAVREDPSLKAVLRKRAENIENPRAKKEVADLTEDRVFGGNTYVLNRNKYEEDEYDDSKFSILVSTNYLRKDENIKNLLNGVKYQNRVLIVCPKNKEDVLNDHGIISKAKRLISARELSEEYDEDGDTENANEFRRMLEDERNELVEKIKTKFCTWIKFTEINSELEVQRKKEDISGVVSGYEHLKSVSQADELKVAKTIQNEVDEEEQGVLVSELSDSFMIQKSYPLVTDRKFYEYLKKSLDKFDISIQKQDGTISTSDIEEIDDEYRVYHNKHAPEDIEDLKIDYHTDIKYGVVGDSGYFNVETNNYDKDELSIKWYLDSDLQDSDSFNWSNKFTEKGRYNITAVVEHEELEKSDRGEFEVKIEEEESMFDIQLETNPNNPPFHSDNKIIFTANPNEMVEPNNYKWLVNDSEKKNKGSQMSMRFEPGEHTVEVSAETKGGFEDRARVSFEVKDRFKPEEQKLTFTQEDSVTDIEEELRDREIKNISIEVEGEYDELSKAITDLKTINSDSYEIIAEVIEDE